jgi:hypothetical protein
MVVQENKSFVWTHKITMSYLEGWTREQQEQIVSRILELYPDSGFHFIEKFITSNSQIEGNANIKSNWYGYPWPQVYMEVLRINANARIVPEIVDSGSGGETITGNATIVADYKIEGTARIEYVRKVCLSSNARIGVNFQLSQITPYIGSTRGCDLVGDLPLTGWRFYRDGQIEHIIRYEGGNRIDRWVPKVTKIEFWFNPPVSDDGSLMLEGIEDLFEYYYLGKVGAVYVADNQFRVPGDFTDRFYEGIEVQINTPEFCVKSCNGLKEEWEELMHEMDENPFQIANADITASSVLKGDAKINSDLHNVVVVSSVFNGTYTIVTVEGESIKDSECMAIAWNDSVYSSVTMSKNYYSFSANARIQAYCRSTGRIYYLLGKPGAGQETDYGYVILDVGE